MINEFIKNTLVSGVMMGYINNIDPNNVYSDLCPDRTNSGVICEVLAGDSVSLFDLSDATGESELVDYTFTIHVRSENKNLSNHIAQQARHFLTKIFTEEEERRLDDPLKLINSFTYNKSDNFPFIDGVSSLDLRSSTVEFTISYYNIMLQERLK